MKTINAPVLLVTFNRPDTTIKVVESLRKAKITKLYVFNDAPRKGNKKDEEARKEILKIVDSIDWDCKIHTNFAQVNFGCGKGVSSAITWAFENEDRLIILEDDCVPAQPFFNYCDELLEKYKNDTRVWMISGNNYSSEFIVANYDYFFSFYAHIQGWATWKRCWKSFDLKMKDFLFYEKYNLAYDIFGDQKLAKQDIKKNKSIYEDVNSNPHRWAHQFGFAGRLNNALGIVPKTNLVTNIGYKGVHTSGKVDFHDWEVDERYELKFHPKFVLVNRKYDEYHKRTYIERDKKVGRFIKRKFTKAINFIKKKTCQKK